MLDGKLSGLLEIGNQIPIRDKDRSQFMGLVKELTEKSVKMDFSHPLAEKNLDFSGETIDIQNAGEDEFVHGYTHGQDRC